MNIFLTGGTGFIGIPLTKALLSRGWNVVALARRPDSGPARALASLGVRIVPGDVTDRASMRAGMTGADIVVHNAAWYEIGLTTSARKTMRAINIDGTDNVLGLALELGIARVVYVSSTVYFGETGPGPVDETYQRQMPYRSYYEQTKAEAHELALQYRQRGLPVTLVCPGNVMGPNDHAVWGHFLRLYLNRMLPPFAWAADHVNTGAHVEDIAEGIALAAEKGAPGETYILAGEPVRVRDVLAFWATRPGGFRVRFYIPAWLAAVMFAPMAPLLRLLGIPAFLSRETVSANVHLNHSSAKARRELGWTYRPARAMWLEIVDEEIALMAKRDKRDLASRLRPLEVKA